MKKFIIAALCLVAAAPVAAQHRMALETGDTVVLMMPPLPTDTPVQKHAKRWWLGGSIGYQSTDRGSNKLSQFDFQPEAGYNFCEWLGVGLQLGYTHNKYKEEGGSSTANMFTIAPFVRSTFLEWRALRLFVDTGLALGFGDGMFDEQNGFSTGKTTAIGLGIQPGVSVRLGRHASLVGNVNLFDVTYSQVKDAGDYEDTTVENWHVGVNSPFSVGGFTVGFQYTF